MTIEGSQSTERSLERTTELVEDFAGNFKDYLKKDTTAARRMSDSLTKIQNETFPGKTTPVVVSINGDDIAQVVRHSDEQTADAFPFKVDTQGVMVASSGEINDSRTLIMLEFLTAALDDETTERLIAESPAQRELVHVWNSLQALTVTSPHLRVMYADVAGKIALFKDVVEKRDTRRRITPLPPETVAIGDTLIPESGFLKRTEAQEIFLRLISPRPFMDDSERERFGRLVEQVFPGMTDRFMKFHDGQLSNRQPDSSQKEKQDLAAATEGRLDKGAVEAIINSIITNGSLDQSQIQVAVYAARHLGINPDLIETLARFLHDEKDEKTVQRRYDKQREVGQQQGEIERLKIQLHDAVPREEVRKAFMIILSLLSKEQVTSEDMKRITAIGRHFSSRPDDKTVSQLMQEFENTPGIFNRLKSGFKK